MMDDDDDEDMAEAGAETPVEAEDDAEAMDEDSALDKPQEPEMKEEVTVSGGKRRGRRKVMKKKTYKDEDGYLGEIHLNSPSISQEANQSLQSRKKKPHGSRSAKMSQSPRSQR